MKYTNENIFDLYISLLESNKKEKIRICTKLRSLIFYILTGYIFHRCKSHDNLYKLNVFQETKKIYNGKKFVIYSVISGNYDKILDPIYYDDSIDYYMFTDSNIPKNSVWKKISFESIGIENLSPFDQTRYVKTHPHLFFQDYDYSMYIDGNVRITCDIKPLFYTLIEEGKTIALHNHQCRDCAYDEAKVIIASGRVKILDIIKQMKTYRKERFPKHYGLFEMNIILRKHNDPLLIQIMEEWWNQILNYAKRDQLSFTYVLWKLGLDKNYILSLGNNSRLNPYFIVRKHL